MCKHEGCNRPFYARRMCMHHYGLFMKRAQRRGLKVGRPYIGSQLKGVLPCTIKKVSEELETHLISTQKAMRKLHAEKKIHIVGFEFTGARWAAIYALGKGVDAVMTPAQIRAMYNERRRAAHAKRTAIPPPPASIFAALGL